MKLWNNKKERDIRVGVSTDIGPVRSENQDSYGRFPKEAFESTPDGLIASGDDLLFVVADGMGGHEGGQEASRTAVQAVGTTYLSNTGQSAPDRLRVAFEQANRDVFHCAHNGEVARKMGTTCTALGIVNDQLYIAHVGDSRCYRIDEDGIEQVTDDHTMVDELRRQGVLTEEEARNHPRRHALIRAMGNEEDIEVDVLGPIPRQPRCQYLLCSDGLAPVSDQDIQRIVMENRPQDACDQLIQKAIAGGGTDNVTVLIVSF